MRIYKNIAIATGFKTNIKNIRVMISFYLSGNSNFLGRRYIQNQDAALILIYDVNGVISGLQIGVSGNIQRV